MVKCSEKDCNKHGTFGYKEKKEQYCMAHKNPDMIDISHKLCIYDGCNIRPSYGEKTGKTQYCSKHKSISMINLLSKICLYNDCNIISTYGISGEKAEYCVKHKKPEMIDLKHKKCMYKGCYLRQTYGIKGGKAQFCVDHKMTNMVDVSNKKCEFEGCNKQPNFGNKNGKIQFCKIHKSSIMIDVSNKKCKFEECTLQPTFGLNGNPQYCVKHKQAKMIDLHHPVCEYEGCGIRPNFGINGISQFCSKHKTNEMVDTTHKSCVIENCTTRAYYGKPGNPKSHCAKHREKGMIKHPNAKCKTCKEPAIYGTNWIPLHCEIHKTTDEENYLEQPCTNCGLTYILDKENKCENCNPESFQKARLAKQNGLMDYLDARDLKGTSTDTIVNSECGKERPDRVYDFNDKIVILECDEHQHKDRQCLCEQTRMINIGQSFGGLPVYFIRWNPDDYSSEKEPEILSKRYKLVGDLIASIKKGKTELPNALVSALYMYYDEWVSLSNEQWKVLSEFTS